MWDKGAQVEVYDFEGENWREAIVLQPTWMIDGYPYLQLRYTTSSDADDFAATVWMAPELVERHVRPAS
jgi:hypothetical protein